MSGQRYIERPPIPALGDLVSSVWIQQVARDARPYGHPSARVIHSASPPGWG